MNADFRLFCGQANAPQHDSPLKLPVKSASLANTRGLQWRVNPEIHEHPRVGDWQPGHLDG